MGKYFGTDGFRGRAGVTLSCEHAYKIGRFLGWYLKNGTGHLRAVIGKDTRLSSYMLEYAIASGLCASGADAYMLHVTTTPSVSYACISEGFDIGIMISASHNPYYDNGIKLFSSNGKKLSDDITLLIEKYIDGDFSLSGGCDIPLCEGSEIGRIFDHSYGRNRYIGYLISLAKRSFKGLKIGLDCANGSTFMIAKSVFDALGAKSYTIGSEPDGLNINLGVGSTHIEALRSFVLENGLDMGFAFDGDGDRCIAVDHLGEIINGDKIIYILASQLKKSNELFSNTVSVTVMSNIGLLLALDKLGIRYERTQVGDKYVYESMEKGGYSLGGEESGHIILSKYATTGDGILTSIMLCLSVLEEKTTLNALAREVILFPQVIKSVSVNNKDTILNCSEVKDIISQVEGIVDKAGRVLVRKSGTEPVIRIMIEGQTKKDCEYFANKISEVIEKNDK